MPTVPMRMSAGWAVVGAAPEENAAVVPVAPAEVSIPVTPENSSTLRCVSADDGYVSVTVPPGAKHFHANADQRDCPVAC